MYDLKIMVWITKPCYQHLNVVYLIWHAWVSFISMKDMIISLCKVCSDLYNSNLLYIEDQECVANRWENAQQISKTLPLVSRKIKAHQQHLGLGDWQVNSINIKNVAFFYSSSDVNEILDCQKHFLVR